MSQDRQRIPSFPAADGGKPVSLADLGAPTCDAHAHLDMLDDPVGALVRAGACGIDLVASVVDLTEEPERTLEGLARWLAKARSIADGFSPVPEVVLIAGVHPHNASAYGDEVHERLAALTQTDPRVRALGELGLDFHYDHSPRDDQRDMFRRQLALAHEADLPVVIHLREAHAEGLDTLREVGVPSAGCIIHCFTEGPEFAEAFLALSDAVVISFAGPVTFAKAEQIREAAAIVPIDRLLVETDSPFLAPAPYRGRPNEPAFATLNAAKVAAAKGLPPVDVATAALVTARRLFRVAPDVAGAGDRS
jgi:TatD DNase family protein